MPTDIHIDRLELDLRGISPAAARAAMEKLGPMLEQALAARQAGESSSANRIDAGVLRLASIQPHGVAAAISERLASQLSTPSQP